MDGYLVFISVPGNMNIEVSGVSETRDELYKDLALSVGLGR